MTVSLIQGASTYIQVRAEARLAGLEAQQAEKVAAGAGDSGPSSSGRRHRPAHLGQAGLGRHRAAREPPQRRSGRIGSLAPGDVIAFHDSFELPGRADDQRGMDMTVAEEVPYLTDGGRPGMAHGSGEHHLARGTPHLIHGFRIKTAARARSAGNPAIFAPGYPAGAWSLPRTANWAGSVASRASRNRSVADTDSCRHRASV
jgi:hypothetical protein